MESSFPPWVLKDAHSSFSRSPWMGSYTASLSLEMSFLSPKTERYPSFIVSLLTDTGPAGFPSALRQRIPAIHFENL